MPDATLTHLLILCTFLALNYMNTMTLTNDKGLIAHVQCSTHSGRFRVFPPTTCSSLFCGSSPPHSPGSKLGQVSYLASPSSSPSPKSCLDKASARVFFSPRKWMNLTNHGCSFMLSHFSLPFRWSEVNRAHSS